MTGRASPLAGAVELLARYDGGARSRVLVDPADPVFAGHYPGFPVLPGVYLVEFADQTARAWSGPAGRLELHTVESCRFHRPVYPGEEITVELSVSELPVSGDTEELRCSAAVGAAGEPAADIRLRYRSERAR